jgi:CrcB protein
MQVVLVAVAGALGTLSRYGLGRAAGTLSFPWTTLAINLAGSFALGVVVKGALEHGWSSTTSAALGTGFLGGFTTFSAASLDVVEVEGRSGRDAAITRALVVPIGAILACALGVWLAGGL